jgi:predicted phage terminase large subunit-like protein
MVFMPPQHGKSELVSRRFPAWMLGKDPNLRLIAASHTRKLAVSLNRDVQRIMLGDEYKNLFPGTEIARPRWSFRDLFPPRRTMDFLEILDRIPLDQIVRKLIVFCDQYKPDHVGVEAEQFQELLVHEIKRQTAGRPGRLPVWKMTSCGISKVARIRRLTHYVINRELRFKADSPGCRLLVDQLMDFPLAEHDDGPDALEMCIRLPLDMRRMR